MLGPISTDRPGNGNAATVMAWHRLNVEASMELGEAMQAEGWVQAECMKHPDYKEAFEAFNEKRPKDFARNR